MKAFSIRLLFWAALLFTFYGAAGFCFTGANAGNFLTFGVGLALVWDILLYKTGRLRALFKFCAFCTAAGLIFFGCMTAFIALESKSSVNYREDAAIVLGAGIKGERVSTMLKARLDTAVIYLNKNMKAVVVVSGGRGAWESISEALAMKRYLVAAGIAEERILLEDKSANTYQNLKYSKAVLDAHFKTASYGAACITSRSHLYRARSLGKKIGLEMTGLGAPVPFYLWPPVYLRETLALSNYWVRF